jgi:hypothetical protein
MFLRLLSKHCFGAICSGWLVPHVATPSNHLGMRRRIEVLEVRLRCSATLSGRVEGESATNS